MIILNTKLHFVKAFINFILQKLNRTEKATGKSSFEKETPVTGNKCIFYTYSIYVIFTDVIASDPATVLSLKISTFSFASFNANE